MKTDRELLQQALDALLHSDSPSQKRADAIAALREALAAPQPEPYGHVTTHTVTGQQFFYRYPSPPYLDTAKECIAVYAAPPAAPAPAVPAISPLALRALRMADMALASWENGYAFDSHGPGREAQRLVTDALALSAAPAVREPQPAELLGMAVVDSIADDGMRNAAGGIYATCVQEFAREVQVAFAQQNRVDLSGIGGGGK